VPWRGARRKATVKNQGKKKEEKKNFLLNRWFEKLLFYF
jgi:hypothetical protein